MSLSVYPLILGILLAAFGIIRQQQIHRVYLEVSLKAEAPGITQIFWDTGDGFNEQDSVAASIRHGDEEKTVRFRLPETAIHQIRFDPNNHKGWFEIYRLGIVDGAGHRILKQGMRELLIPQTGIGPINEEEDELSFDLTHNDPIFLLDIDSDTLNNSMTSIVAKRGWVWSFGIGGIALALAYIGYFLIGGWSGPVILAYINWQIFAPGILSPDSLDQYWQAFNHRYWNWHPPAMAILLHHFLEMGLTLSQVIFLQILGGFTGVFFLILKLLKVFNRQKGMTENRAFCRYAALAGLLIVASPLTSFAPFISTFWKDVWCAIAMIWIAGISLHLMETGSGKSRLRDLILMLLLLALMNLSILVRYNAILLVPAYGVILYLAARRFPVFFRVAGVGIMILGTLFSNSILMSVYKVNRLDPKLSVMGLELVGLVVLYPDLLEELPYTKSQLKEDYQERFVWAAYRELKWNDDSIVKADFVKSKDNPDLKYEYFRSVSHHPIKMAQVKILNFVQLLDPRTTAEWCPRGIPDNNYGFEPNFLFSDLRGRYYRNAYAVLKHPVLRWISCVHLVWVILSLVFLGFGVRAWFEKKTSAELMMLAFSAMAPLYYFSYLLASPWRAFRYMYPATLLIQLVFVAMAVVALRQLGMRIGKKADHS